MLILFGDIIFFKVMILGKDCDAYPDLTKYSWSCYKKYGKFSAASTTDDCFIIDKSISSAARLIQNRPGLIIEPGKVSQKIFWNVKVDLRQQLTMERESELFV